MGADTPSPTETLKSFSSIAHVRVRPEHVSWFSTLSSSKEDIKQPGEVALALFLQTPRHGRGLISVS